MPDLELIEHLSELRREFDGSFARRPAPGREAPDELLTITVGAERYAVRLGAIFGLFLDRPVTALPGGLPGLLGVAGFRSSIVAVHDLATWLGGTAQQPHWLMLTANRPVIALAFDAVLGRLQVPRSAVAPSRLLAGGRGRYISETVHTGAGPCPVIDIAAVHASVVHQVGQFRPAGSGTGTEPAGE